MVRNEKERTTPNLAIALGLTIRQLRRRCGLTQKALAETAGVSQSWVSITENVYKYKRNKNPPIEVLRCIALAFGLSGLSELIGFAEAVMNDGEKEGA